MVEALSVVVAASMAGLARVNAPFYIWEMGSQKMAVATSGTCAQLRGYL
jgi:hypothetical protein